MPFGDALGERPPETSSGGAASTLRTWPPPSVRKTRGTKILMKGHTLPDTVANCNTVRSTRRNSVGPGTPPVKQRALLRRMSVLGLVPGVSSGGRSCQESKVTRRRTTIAPPPSVANILALPHLLAARPLGQLRSRGSTVHASAVSMKRGHNFPLKVRAHANPFDDAAFDVPRAPSEFKYQELYEEYMQTAADGTRQIEACDVGCAWGGMLARMSGVVPETLMLGLEIRAKVASFAAERLVRLRIPDRESDPSLPDAVPGSCKNVAVIRSNAMRYLPNYFEKGQLSRIFFVHPDPCFKNSQRRRRIISCWLLAEYAFVLREGGFLYTVTDVEDLHRWHERQIDPHPLFRRVSDEELQSDPFFPVARHASEDAQKIVKSKSLTSFYAVYQRISSPPPPPTPRLDWALISSVEDDGEQE